MTNPNHSVSFRIDFSIPELVVSKGKHLARGYKLIQVVKAHRISVEDFDSWFQSDPQKFLEFCGLPELQAQFESEAHGWKVYFKGIATMTHPVEETPEVLDSRWLLAVYQRAMARSNSILDPYRLPGGGQMKHPVTDRFRVPTPIAPDMWAKLEADPFEEREPESAEAARARTLAALVEILPPLLPWPSGVSPAGYYVYTPYEGIHVLWDGETLFDITQGSIIEKPALTDRFPSGLPLIAVLSLPPKCGILERKDLEDDNFSFERPQLSITVFDVPNSAEKYPERVQAAMCSLRGTESLELGFLQPWLCPSTHALLKRMHRQECVVQHLRHPTENVIYRVTAHDFPLF